MHTFTVAVAQDGAQCGKVVMCLRLDDKTSLFPLSLDVTRHGVAGFGGRLWKRENEKQLSFSSCSVNTGALVSDTVKYEKKKNPQTLLLQEEMKIHSHIRRHLRNEVVMRSLPLEC